MFWSYSKWQQIRVLQAWKGLLSNFWWLRSVTNLKFTEENVICMEKHVLVKKCLQMDLTCVCYYEPDSKRQLMEWKYTDSLLKKVLGATVNKEGHTVAMF